MKNDSTNLLGSQDEDVADDVADGLRRGDIVGPLGWERHPVYAQGLTAGGNCRLKRGREGRRV